MFGGIQIGVRSALEAAGLGLAMVCSAVAISVACDNFGASQSVGACHTGVLTCNSHLTPYNCEHAESTMTYEIKEDFPTSCVSKQGYNCNMPNDDCYRRTGCEWMNGQCQTKSGTNSWIKEQKRTDAKCGS